MFLETEKIKFPNNLKQAGPLIKFKYLKKDNHMEGLVLGQCLDSCRWGSITSVMYEANTLEMAEFIKIWMDQNKDDLRFSYSDLGDDFRLPYINNNVCPRNEKHKTKVKALDGTIRCGNEKAREIKKEYMYSYSYFDSLSKSQVKKYVKTHPLSGAVCEEDVEELMRRYDNSKDTIKIIERCGAILSDNGVTLPLIEILDRINLHHGGFRFCESDGTTENYCYEAKELGVERKCFGHVVQDHFVMPMDGWALAANVQRWYEQLPEHNAPIATKRLVKNLVGKSVTPDKFNKELEKWNKKFELK